MELREPLKAKGRVDLVRAIDEIIERSIWGESKWKRTVKQIDNRYLGGCLLNLKRRYSPGKLKFLTAEAFRKAYWQYSFQYNDNLC